MIRALGLFMIVLLTACAPSTQSIQTAIAQTQAAAATPTQLPTNTPSPTPTRQPTATANPANIYQLHIGFCAFGDLPAGQDPEESGCQRVKVDQVVLLPGKPSVTLSTQQELSELYPYLYCTLHDHTGALISAHLGNFKEQSVTCYLHDPATATPDVIALATQQAARLRAPKGDGYYLVNVDIAPGTWRSPGHGDSCYWELTTETGDIVDNHFGLAGGTIHVPASAFQLQVEDCGDIEFLK